jgi:hypothetical protein
MPSDDFATSTTGSVRVPEPVRFCIVGVGTSMASLETACACAIIGAVAMGPTTTAIGADAAGGLFSPKESPASR